MCNKHQLAAQFILTLFRQSTSTRFGHICSPSSGGILYIYNNWYVLCFSVDCLMAALMFHPNPATTVVCVYIHVYIDTYIYVYILQFYAWVCIKLNIIVHVHSSSGTVSVILARI